MDKLVGRIYAILCKSTNKQYIGSTIYPLKFRLQKHEKAFQGHNKNPLKVRYCSSFDILQGQNYEIRLLELNEYEKREDMLEHERKYIQSLDNVVNRYIPSRSIQEYNKEKYQTLKETDHYKKHIQCRCGRKYT